MNPRVEFSSILQARLFHTNGNDYMKMSSRTARMLSNGRIFYFCKNELVSMIALNEAL